MTEKTDVIAEQKVELQDTKESKPETKERVEGIGLFFLRFYALIVKKMIYTQRRFVLYLMMVNNFIHDFNEQADVNFFVFSGLDSCCMWHAVSGHHELKH